MAERREVKEVGGGVCGAKARTHGTVWLSDGKSRRRSSRGYRGRRLELAIGRKFGPTGGRAGQPGRPRRRRRNSRGPTARGGGGLPELQDGQDALDERLGVDRLRNVAGDADVGGLFHALFGGVAGQEQRRDGREAKIGFEGRQHI